ncbi:DUF3797 domain-containing protein [Brevibacillus laterosporus]|uniref:DUF3797 domain-containing protein n=1 Tax=Brevibacillus laterosporus TaxID=1465 RepID=UPI003D21A46D
MNPYESNILMKKYNVCPECRNDKIGGSPSQGTINIEDEVFTRSCKCGWKVIVDRRIKCCAYATFKSKGKTSGVYEVSIHGQGRKYLSVKELKELSGVKRVDHTSKIEEWLNSSEGRKWALEVKPAIIP